MGTRNSPPPDPAVDVAVTVILSSGTSQRTIRTRLVDGAAAAFTLYERNWRFVDARATPEHERALIDVLARKFGHGLINA